MHLAHALDRLRVEPGLGERQGQQLHRLVAVFGERLEAAVEGIAAVLEAHAHGEVLHALLECLGREVAGALIQNAGQEVGEALLAHRVLHAAAALEGEAHGDQRHAVGLDQPGADPAGAPDLLHLHGLRLVGEDRHCRQQDGADHREGPGAGTYRVRHCLRVHRCHRVP
jgi:hypothetical protein